MGHTVKLKIFIPHTCSVCTVQFFLFAVHFCFLMLQMLPALIAAGGPAQSTNPSYNPSPWLKRSKNQLLALPLAEAKLGYDYRWTELL